MRIRCVLSWLSVLALGACLGCGSEPSGPSAEAPGGEPEPAAAAPAAPEKPAAASPAARQEAEQIFATRCATCHGPTGAGDGPGSAALDPKPRNFHDAAWQASVDDAHIANIIQYGGAAVGKSPTMPGNPDLTSKPEVVQALVSVIRELGKS
jgi:mono/diheme cytochrome c family protein